MSATGGLLGREDFSIGEDMVPRNKVNRPIEEWTWRDHVFNGISLDEKFKMEDMWDEHTRKMMDSILTHTSPEETIVNSRDTNVRGITLSNSSENDFKSKSDVNGKLITKRKRKATKKGNKNYPTKPKKDYKKMNKEVLYEQHLEGREAIYEPLYDSSPFDVQPFSTNANRLWEKGPDIGVWRSMNGIGVWYPPYEWIYPKLEYEKIWCFINLMDNFGHPMKYRLNGTNDQGYIGIQFYDNEGDVLSWSSDEDYIVSPVKYVNETLEDYIYRPRSPEQISKFKHLPWVIKSNGLWDTEANLDERANTKDIFGRSPFRLYRRRGVYPRNPPTSGGDRPSHIEPIY